MKNNNRTIAPQTENVQDMYTVWQEDNYGTMDQFFEFMTTPSMERALFLAKFQKEDEVIDSFVMEKFSI